MNQGIAFARTIRALEADSFRASRLGLLVAAIVLGAWTWWLLAARVPQFETTSNVRIDSGRIIAYFPPDTLSRLRADQPALIRFNNNALPARVQTVALDHADLVFTNPQSPIPNAARANATADIETARVSPAAIAFRTLTRATR